METEMYTLRITPRQADRARFSKGKGVHNTKNYHLYKKQLQHLLKGHTLTFSSIGGTTVKSQGIKIPARDYYGLKVILHKPYPKSTPKYKRIDGARRRVKPDVDNEAKAVIDAITAVKLLLKCDGAIGDDGQISDLDARKRWTTDEEGRIEFKLYYDGEY